MSIKKAQAIVNNVDDHFGISLVAYTDSELELLKTQIVEFLELNIATEDLQDPGNDGGDDEEEFSDEDYAQIEDDINADY